MNLPRLIIADEPNSGAVSAGAILIYAMIRAGMKVRVFTYGREESEVRLLKLLLDEPVTCLDLYTFGSVKNLKTLFQRSAAPDALNVVLAFLGTRPEEEYIQINPELPELAKALSCSIVPIFSAAASAILTANIASAALNALENPEDPCVLGVIFASVKNPREYQLLEQDYGRKTPVLTLGYIPKEIERRMPSLQDLYHSGTSIRMMQIKSAAMQLSSISNQIEWRILEAFGKLKQEWTAPLLTRYISKRFKVAVVGDKTLSLEGSSAVALFTLLGCEAADYDPWQDPFPLDAEVVYFPHSLGAFYADRLLTNDNFCRGIRQSFAANKLILVNGASAPLFGQSFVTSDGQKHEGLGFFPFHGGYSTIQGESDLHKVEVRGLVDTLFSKTDEKLRGYSLDYVRISNPGNIVPPIFAYRDIRKDKEHGNSGWLKGYCLVTDLRLELWGSMDIVHRWLSLRKR